MVEVGQGALLVGVSGEARSCCSHRPWGKSSASADLRAVAVKGDDVPASQIVAVVALAKRQSELILVGSFGTGAARSLEASARVRAEVFEVGLRFEAVVSQSSCIRGCPRQASCDLCTGPTNLCERDRRFHKGRAGGSYRNSWRNLRGGPSG